RGRDPFVNGFGARFSSVKVGYQKHSTCNAADTLVWDTSPCKVDGAVILTGRMFGFLVFGFSFVPSIKRRLEKSFADYSYGKSSNDAATFDETVDQSAASIDFSSNVTGPRKPTGDESRLFWLVGYNPATFSWMTITATDPGWKHANELERKYGQRTATPHYPAEAVTSMHNIWASP
ncbi:hypothetical protein F5878DRAFT_647177, partial [Lentinula raphanica]